jgi:hypothetical protein
MNEPIDKNYSILGNDTKPEPKIRYTLPDGSTTIWLNEYVDAMVQAEQDRILKWIEANRSAIELEPGNNLYRDHFNSQSLIAFIKGENK